MAAQESEFLAAFRAYHEHGLAPVAGGYMDQSVEFLSAADLLDGYIGRIQADKSCQTSGRSA